MLVGMAGYDLPLWFIHRRIAEAIDIVVHCARLSGGVRKVVQISEVAGREGETISMHDLFVFEQSGLDEEGKAVGEFQATGIRPHCLQRMHAMGVDLPQTMFQPRTLSSDRVGAIKQRGL